MESQKRHRRCFSFEFFPPNTPEGAEKLAQTAKQLAQLKPEFFSVTYGAGGSTRERTLNAVLDLCRAGHAAAPHISCIGSSRTSVRAILDEYRSHGIKHLVALRGDLPSGTASAGEFHYANELVEFIRSEFGSHFFIEVAAYPEYHPQSRNAQEDLQAFRRKVEAGADSAITQYFFNADAYFHFVDECEAMGLDVPVVPGIMPIGRFSHLGRVRRGDSAVDPQEAGKLWRRSRVDSCVRARRGHGPLRPAPRERCTGTSLLHAEPGGPHVDHLAAAGAIARNNVQPGFRKT
jgi:methylenetetrahydrofolate reductase (NADPH)